MVMDKQLGLTIATVGMLSYLALTRLVGPHLVQRQLDVIDTLDWQDPWRPPSSTDPVS